MDFSELDTEWIDIAVRLQQLAGFLTHDFRYHLAFGDAARLQSISKGEYEGPKPVAPPPWET